MYKKAKTRFFVSILSLSILIIGLILGITLLQNTQDIHESAAYTIPEPSNYPPPRGEEAYACGKVGGVWKTFSNSCVDRCYDYKLYPKRACLTVLTDGCDCGPGKCWTGERCIPDSKYPRPSITKVPPSPFPTKPQISISPNPTIIIPPPICNPYRMDVNNDGKVNILDIITVVRGLRKPVEKFPCLDVNEDGVINILDILIVIREFKSQ